MTDSDWSVEDLARIAAARQRHVRLGQARNAPRSTSETRVALVAFERGIPDSELEQFWYVNRKGAKQRFFNHEAFAKKYGVDIHWVWDGELSRHPRGPAPRSETRSNVRPYGRRGRGMKRRRRSNKEAGLAAHARRLKR